MKKIYLITIGLLLIPSLVFAIPGLPHQFYGTVTVNGVPAANGTKVEAKIGSTVIVSKITTDGKYGYNPNVFMISDPDANNSRVGQIIVFFVEGVDTGKTAVFSGGTLTKLDVSITTSSGDSPGGGGPTGGSSPTPQPSPGTGSPGGSQPPAVNNPVSTPPTPPTIPNTPQIPSPLTQGQILGEKIIDSKARVAEVVQREKARVKKADIKLTQRLVGRILLQTQEKGEAWYIPVGKTTKYYLADGPSAFSMLRSFGLGISNTDIAKISVGSEKRFKDEDTDKDGLPDKLEEGLNIELSNNQFNAKSLK